MIDHPVSEAQRLSAIALSRSLTVRGRFESEMSGLCDFGADQRTFEVEGVGIGGVPGQHPVVRAGTLFYHRHKVVKDENAGAFDEDAAGGLLKTQDEMSNRSGKSMVLSFSSTTERFLRDAKLPM